MTMTEEIFAKHAGLNEVQPGQLIKAKLVLVLGNDITSSSAIKEFEQISKKMKLPRHRTEAISFPSVG